MAARTHLSKCATGEVQKVLHTLQRNELEPEKAPCPFEPKTQKKKKTGGLPHRNLLTIRDDGRQKHRPQPQKSVDCPLRNW